MEGQTGRSFRALEATVKSSVFILRTLHESNSIREVFHMVISCTLSLQVVLKVACIAQLDVHPPGPAPHPHENQPPGLGSSSSQERSAILGA